MTDYQSSTQTLWKEIVSSLPIGLLIEDSSLILYQRGLSMTQGNFL